MNHLAKMLLVATVVVVGVAGLVGCVSSGDSDEIRSYAEGSAVLNHSFSNTTADKLDFVDSSGGSKPFPQRATRVLTTADGFFEPVATEVREVARLEGWVLDGKVDDTVGYLTVDGRRFRLSISESPSRGSILIDVDLTN